MFRPSCLLLPYYCDTLVLHQSSQLNLIGNNRKFKMAKIVKFHPSLLHCIGAPDGCEGWVGFGDVGHVAPIPPPVQLNNNLLVADNLYYQMILNLIVKSGTSKLCTSDSCVWQFILFLYCWSLTNCWFCDLPGHFVQWYSWDEYPSPILDLNWETAIICNSASACHWSSGWASVASPFTYCQSWGQIQPSWTLYRFSMYHISEIDLR